MDKTVRSYVESQGIPYVRVDFNKIKDDGYFDFDHMNSVGVQNFTPMFVEVLRPYLQ